MGKILSCWRCKEAKAEVEKLCLPCAKSDIKYRLEMERLAAREFKRSSRRLQKFRLELLKDQPKFIKDALLQEWDISLEQLEESQIKESEQKGKARSHLSYEEYLQTPYWQERRKRALEYADYRCQLCNNTSILHVHHRTYENLGREPDNDLTVLCESCHEKFHDIVVYDPIPF